MIFLGCNMSGGLDVLRLKEEDYIDMLAANTHLCADNFNFQMKQYAFKRDGKLN